MNKTIVIVINTSWNIFNFRMGLIEALQAKGYRVVAIAPRDDYSVQLQERGIEYHEIVINSKGMNPFKKLLLIYRLYRLYKVIAPDVVLLYTIKPNIFGSIAAWFSRTPVISNISGLGTLFINRSIYSKIASLLYDIALHIPRKIFFQNSYDRSLFIKLKLVEAVKSELIPGSGINTSKFTPTASDSNKKGIEFLFVARLVRDKGLVEYVEAAREIKKLEGMEEIEFAILGSFYEGNPTAITPNQMQIWQEEGIVNYLGVTDDVQSVVGRSDCVVLPSYREGMSRVLLEAASMAKPIITTRVPGCKEVVDDGINGYLCRSRDRDSLATQMKKMIMLSSDERVEMGRRGREKMIAEFEEKIVIDKYLETIQEIIAEDEAKQ